MATGPDVSSYQPGITGTAVKAAGHSFAIVKVTQGTGYTNPQAASQIASFRQAGLPLGLYAFLTAGNGVGQGSYFLSQARRYSQPGDLPMIADFESTSAGNPTHADLHGWRATVEAMGFATMTYTNKPYWDAYGQGCADCATRPLWLANYPYAYYKPTVAVPPANAMPPAPSRWSRPVMWQFTDQHTSVPGYSLDMSVISDADLAALRKVAPTQGVFMALTDAEQAELLANARLMSEALTRLRSVDTRTFYALEPLPSDGPGHEPLGSNGQGELLVRARTVDAHTADLVTRPSTSAADIAAAIPAALAQGVVDELQKRLAKP